MAAALLLVVALLMKSLWFIGCVNEEGAALLSFKSSMEGDPDGSFANWNSSDPNPCSWNGIACQAKLVVSISIPKKKLVGILSASLGSLSSLRHINLRNNMLHGTLPMELFNARRLQSLVLYGNNMSGPLPSDIGKLSYLQMLNLAQNFFNGSLPVSLLECKRLRTLDVGYNKFTGPLPDRFGTHLKQVEKLDLSHNSFDGHVPGDLGTLSHLEGTLDLSHNNFSGHIPASLGNLPEKVYIDVSDNNLSGPIPQNGALVNRGPTAFLGNPMLCGSPLKNPCLNDSSSPSEPFLPGNHSPPAHDSGELLNSSKVRGFSSTYVIAIVVGDVVGIALIALVFLYCYWRMLSSRSKVDDHLKGRKERSECLCFRKDGSGALSENIEQLDLVPLDSQVNFDLDELLNASAFVLGKSGIGIVYKVVLEDGLTLAVRRLGEGGLQRFKEFQTEVEAIGKVRHPNIVPLRAYYWSIDEKLLIYDYIPNGNLSAALHGKTGSLTNSPMSWLVRLSIMKGVAKGLAFLHEYSPKKYVHGDLKPSNILLGHNMKPYIADFGLGRLATIAGGSPLVQSNHFPTDGQQQFSEVSDYFPATSNYQAPEALKLLKPSQKWDVYSYGVILLEMLSGRSPVTLMGTYDMDIVKWVQLCIEEHKALSDVLDPNLSEELEHEEDIFAVLRTALACVHINPERRPSMRHISESIGCLNVSRSCNF